MMSIRWTTKLNEQRQHDVEQRGNFWEWDIGGDHIKPNKKVFTGTRRNVAFRGLEKISQINTLFYSKVAK